MKYAGYYIAAAAAAMGLAGVRVMGRRRVITFAKDFRGQQELYENTGFTSETMEALMKEIGWRKGDQWCVFFAKMVWYNTAPEYARDAILKVISGNSQQAYKNAAEDQTGLFKVGKYPHVGDIVIWQYYNDQGKAEWKGHGGIVVRINVNDFDTTEGNTNEEGSSRGYMVSKRIRGYDFDKAHGLRLKGFITLNV